MSDDANTTQARLLDAAENLFASKGFDQVSIRELAAAADVNVAAVNYHFQSKENLYREVITRRYAGQRDRTVAALEDLLKGSDGTPDLAEVIGIMVRQYLEGTLAAPEGPGFLMAVSREMHGQQPHVSEALFREMIAPVFQAFSAAILQARPHLTSGQLSWTIASIVGQVHHFIMRWIKRESLRQDTESLAIMMKVFPPLGEPLPEYIRLVTDHVTAFSTAAVDGMFPEVAS